MDIAVLLTNIVQSYLYTIHMIHLNQSIEILTGGSYTGCSSWNKKRSEIDNCLKIYLLTSGSLCLFEGGKEFLLEENKLYFINGNKLTYQSCTGSFSTYWLHFVPKDLIVRQGLFSMPLVTELSQEGGFSQHVLPHIESFISANSSSYQSFYLESLRIQTFLQTVIIQLLEQYPWENMEQIANIQRIDSAIQYINNHFTEIIKLADLARECCMSPNYFHKLFTAALQTTPANYISLLRMNTALQLLVNNKYSIKEIAFQLGYSDDAYFSRVFKKYYGITPGEYKKKRTELLF